jgi:hypothetical protein
MNLFYGNKLFVVELVRIYPITCFQTFHLT